MTGKSLVQQGSACSIGAPTFGGGSVSSAGSYPLRAYEFQRTPEESSLDRLCAEQFEAMRNPLSRGRKTAQSSTSTTTAGNSGGGNIDVAPSSASASSTRITNRFYRPSSHKTTAASDSSTSRSSALSLRFGSKSNQSSVSVRNEESYKSRSTRDDDSYNTATSMIRSGPTSTVVPTTGDLLPRLHSASSGNNLLATTSSVTSTTLGSSKQSLVLPKPGTPTVEPKYTGRPRGLVGLQNLGNTCFMNSCLQCVSNLPAVVKYFQSGEYLKEINETSPTKGSLATAFGDLIKALWTSPEFTSTRPVELKRVIGKVASRFTGYDQQDAQEFLRFLLDGLHEDLNRIIKKPPYYEIKDREHAKDREVSDEYWKFYSDRNQSTLSDLFCGQLRSEIRCHTCNHRSLCFDVFWDLSVPVPKKQKSGAHLRMFSSKDDSASPTHANGCSIQDCLKAYTDQEFLNPFVTTK